MTELGEWAKLHYPGAVQTHFWSAQDYTPIDELPYVGPLLPRVRKRLGRNGFRQMGSDQRRGRRAGAVVAHPRRPIRVGQRLRQLEPTRAHRAGDCAAGEPRSRVQSRKGLDQPDNRFVGRHFAKARAWSADRRGICAPPASPRACSAQCPRSARIWVASSHGTTPTRRGSVRCTARGSRRTGHCWKAPRPAASPPASDTPAPAGYGGPPRIRVSGLARIDFSTLPDVSVRTSRAIPCHGRHAVAGGHRSRPAGAQDRRVVVAAAGDRCSGMGAAACAGQQHSACPRTHADRMRSTSRACAPITSRNLNGSHNPPSTPSPARRATDKSQLPA